MLSVVEFFSNSSYLVFSEDTLTAEYKFMKFSSDLSFINILFFFLWIFLFGCAQFFTDNVLRAV